MNYEYEVKNDSIVINKYIGNEIHVVLPEEIDGHPVRRVNDYAFVDRRDVLEISLPETIETIGGHAFYNCRALKRLELFDRVVEMDDGAFKNCAQIKHITMHIRKQKMTCLKNLLSELSQELSIQLDYGTEEKARVVFPKYMYDYVDNVEARIINQVTYGSGVHYRECMSDHDIDYRKYDDTFRVAVVNDTFETLLAICLGRIQYPYHLSDVHKRQYFDFLDEHVEQTIQCLIEQNNMEQTKILAKEQWFDETKIESALQLAHQMNNMEFSSYFLSHKRKNVKPVVKSFEL